MNKEPSVCINQSSGTDLNVQLDQEHDLNTEFAPGCTWESKKIFCEMEAQSYFNDDIQITENPYFKNTWSWKWFNDEYRKLQAEDNEWQDFQDYSESRSDWDSRDQ